MGKFDEAIKEIINAGKDGVAYLEQQIKDVAPTVWKVCRQRVIAETIGYILTSVIILLVGTPFIIAGIKSYSLYGSGIWMVVTGALLGLIGVSMLIGQIIDIFSIDYCTAARILDLIKPNSNND